MNTMVPPIITIGCEGGGPETRAICALKVPLYQALLRHVTSPHCAEIDEYALVFRVDGTLGKFGEEGLAHLRFAKAHRYITVDIQIPEAVWQPMTISQIKTYLADQVAGAIAACATRLRKDKCAVFEEELMAQVGSATNEYLSADNG